MKHGVKGKESYYALRGSWCQRCLGGSIIVQLVVSDRVVDETDWAITSTDTHKLLQQIRSPSRAKA